MKCQQPAFCMNTCCQAEPIIMPKQIINKPNIVFCEQPIIYPLEYRQVNHVVLIPRHYQAVCESTNQTCQCRCEQ